MNLITAVAIANRSSGVRRRRKRTTTDDVGRFSRVPQTSPRPALCGAGRPAVELRKPGLQSSSRTSRARWASRCRAIVDRQALKIILYPQNKHFKVDFSMCMMTANTKMMIVLPFSAVDDVRRSPRSAQSTVLGKKDDAKQSKWFYPPPPKKTAVCWHWIVDAIRMVDEIEKVIITLLLQKISVNPHQRSNWTVK